ncbi:MAG: hypothetical protein CM15mP49_15340 [Actinomycetota bacterium]|nr:MAG: hypothetical protein CM15mP49_15340 [Actinomycetota bacterium]
MQPICIRLAKLPMGWLVSQNADGFNGGVEQTYFIRFDSDNIEFVYEIDTKAGTTGDCL